MKNKFYATFLIFTAIFNAFISFFAFNSSNIFFGAIFLIITFLCLDVLFMSYRILTDKKFIYMPLAFLSLISACIYCLSTQNLIFPQKMVIVYAIFIFSFAFLACNNKQIAIFLKKVKEI